MPIAMQDNTLADRPMVELLTMLMHMLDMARHSAQCGGGSPALHQLVLILADGRFHEKESLRRVVEVRCRIVPEHVCKMFLTGCIRLRVCESLW